ncbi:DUF4198 domain-containing protein [Novosphingobium sp. ZW T3_23]|uniref:DUF4198 domain-containing protein n=1 Tax=Novosphingobium sp. ZW T3_23 TaxID=3378084 RepID=UPI0038538459
MRYSPILIASAALAAVLASPASAHRQWLLPSTTTLAGTSEYVTVDAAVSNDLFYPDHFPMSPDQVTVWTPDGSQGKLENPATGRYRSTFDVKIDKPGTWKIGTQRSAVMGSFKVNGEDWRLGGRGRPMPAAGAGGPGGAPARSVATVADIPANATDVKLTEVQSGNYVYVTSDAPTKTVFTPTGKGLEIDPISHPDELVSNEEGQFRFLIDGKPAAGVKVTVVPGSKKFREAEQAQELTTGADGVLHVKWPVAGMYWINASVSDNKPSEKRATERRMSYTATVEVVAP